MMQSFVGPTALRNDVVATSVAALTEDSSLSHSSAVNSSSNSPCRVCTFKGADVVVTPCGCCLHARCIPVSSLCIWDVVNKNLQAVTPHTVSCPGCRSVTVAKFTLQPLSTESLDIALEKRKAAIAGSQSGDHTSMSSWQQLERSASAVNTPEIQAEHHYLLVLRGHSSSVTGGDTSHQRTGRWTSPEVALTDFLVNAFDQGRLPIEPGLKLSDFLADLLLCKSSRLSKKMKNSQLGTRSYTFRPPPTAPLEGNVLSQLLDRFIQSIASEPMRYELQFNVAKFWRLRLSNLALALHQPALMDVGPWMAGWEFLEQKAAAAQERIREARRKRLGLGCESGVGGAAHVGRPPHSSPSASPTVMHGMYQSTNATATSGVPSSMRHTMPQHNTATAATGVPSSISNTLPPEETSRIITNGSTDTISSLLVSTDMFDELDEYGGAECFLPQPIFPLPVHNQKKRRRNSCADRRTSANLAEGLLDELEAQSQTSGAQSTRYIRSHCGPFLTQLMHYVENHNLPFQHADVWVPSYSNEEPQDLQQQSSCEYLRLFHAGHVTRNDLEWEISQKMEKFGKQSTTVSFTPGHGLAGRVFWKREPEWQQHLNTSSPDVFVRVDVAQECGLKTGFCFPLDSSVIGTICVALYSMDDLPPDPSIIQKCCTDLGRLGPEPKWKLVVEVTGDAPDFSSKTQTEVMMKGHSDLEKRIATLLGDHMPLSDLTSTVPPTEAEKKREALLPHFLSLRLLLLRSPKRRNEKEKERIQLLLESFQGYDNGQRSDEDLAFLIVRDWVYIVES